MLRGHPIVLDANGRWTYVDDGQPTAGNRRPCGHCGGADTEGGHDACLGKLPGVRNACCGHGSIEESYVQLEDGRRLAGKEAIGAFSAMGATVPVTHHREED